MPSAQARAATASHRRELGLLAAAVTRRVNRIAMGADPTDVDRWWARTSTEVLRVVAQGHDAAAGSARRYLVSHAALEGVRLSPVVVAADRAEIATSLHVTGPVAFKTNMRISEDPAVARRVMGTVLTGSAQRLTLGGDRATIMRTFSESDAIVGWRRMTSGSPCPFCSMMASRGAVYSKSSADFAAHDGCGCNPSPLYRREPEPESVRVLQEQWAEATAGTSGAEALKAWREYQTARAAS